MNLPPSDTTPTTMATPRHLSARLALALACAVPLGACTTVGPDYRSAPAVTTGDGWSDAGADAATPERLTHWWQTLGDPVLDRLVTTALERNLDLRQAQARIDEARALRDRVAGGQAPVAAAGAGVTRRRQSENGPLPIDRIPGLDATQTIRDVGFDASWELDLFGGQRRALEGATARWEARRAEAQGVRVRVVAEVARAWFVASGAGEELRAQEARSADLQQAFALTRTRAQAGDASEMDVETARAQWTAAQSLLPAIAARRRAALLGLAVLLGEPPEAGLDLQDATPADIALRPFPVGERADVLRRRPDVYAAERRLAASTADIGVATAELFPKLSISASGGFQALAGKDWFAGSSERLSILPLLSWRLFDGGRVRAEIRAREAATQQAALAYEQAVLSALADAEQALGDYRAGLDRLDQRTQAFDASLRVLEHAQSRLAAGDISRLELLAARRQFHEAALARIHARTDGAIQLVALYKALGGGWDAPQRAEGDVSTATAPAQPGAD
ncbi:efflux transporter outer membrane subunit [Thermomonas sp.]|uniref:efflux transporter outer membrane subunit n=1 Tax=Thermomonas sp. TaxID=1971895 RepID=UPI002616D97F|nr:efflux transporter outer membrane subunit [Thermomonas sp.]MCO5054096.1 efflux transporter outer membrane subunit [Thermomonas sp.]